MGMKGAWRKEEGRKTREKKGKEFRERKRRSER